MAELTVRTEEKDSLTRFLGWFSVALGAAQTFAPGLVCRVVGASGGGRSRRLMRLIGMRELTQGIGILTRPRPTGWMWSRVAGDAVDAAALVVVGARNPGQRVRTGLALASVLAITTPDVYESRHLSRRSGQPHRGKRIRKAVTIHRPHGDVAQAWAAASELRQKVDEAGASVLFAVGPRDRGTELAVEFVHDPPAGDVGAVAQKLRGADLATQLADDLRRFKQEVETGEVVRSDSTPPGHLLAEHLTQRTAQPNGQRRAEAVR